MQRPALQTGSRPASFVLVILSIVAVLSACSTNTKQAATSGSTAATSSTVPASSTITVPGTTSMASTTPSSAISSAGTPSSVLPAPNGYEVDSDGTTNGPITPNEFDKLVGVGAAASTHFLSGYDITYGSNFTDETIESTYLTFPSPADASGFEPALVENRDIGQLSPVKGSFSSIPGSEVLSSTKADLDGFWLIDILAIKGSTLMMVEYANDPAAAPSSVPEVLSQSAIQQYERL